MESTPPTEDELRRAKEVFESSPFGIAWNRVLACQKKLEQANADWRQALRDLKDALDRGDRAANIDAGRREHRYHKLFDALVAERAALMTEALAATTEELERAKMRAAMEEWET